MIQLPGVDAAIRRMFVGIESLGQSDKTWQLAGLPQNQMSALGTRMYVDLEFGPEFPVDGSVILDFKYDGYTSKKNEYVITHGGNKSSETFYIDCPISPKSVKAMGDHIIIVSVWRSYKKAYLFPVKELVGNVTIPYTIVPPAQDERE